MSRNWRHDQISGQYTSPTGEAFIFNGSGQRAQELSKELAEHIAGGGTVHEMALIERMDFIGRFSDQEKGAFYVLVAGGDLEATIFDRMLLAAAQEIDLLHPDTQRFTGWLQGLGILTAERAADILDF